jgi:hypothetical protein
LQLNFVVCAIKAVDVSCTADTSFGTAPVLKTKVHIQDADDFPETTAKIVSS